MDIKAHRITSQKHIRFARWNTKLIQDMLKRGKTKEQVMIRMQVPASEVDRIASLMA